MRALALATAALLSGAVTGAAVPPDREAFAAGTRLLAAHDFRGAAAALEQAVAADSLDGEAFLKLGKAREALGEYDKAISAYERARGLGLAAGARDEDLARLYHRSGVELLERRQYGQAATRLQEAARLQPDSAPAWYALGLCRHGLGQDEAAAADLERAAAADTAFAAPRRALGDLYSQRRQFGLAARQYGLAIAIDSTSMAAHAGLAQSLLEQGESQAALAAARRAVAIAPDFAAGYLLQGIALSKLGRYTEAMRPLEEAVSRAPDDAEARYRLAEAHYGRGAYAEARAEAQEAVGRRRDLAAAAALVADANRQLGRLAEARTWYLRARADERYRDYCDARLREIGRTPAAEK